MKFFQMSIGFAEILALAAIAKTRVYWKSKTR